MNTQLTQSGTPAISSLEIAKITGKHHKEVMRDIRSTLEQAEIDQRGFAQVYKAGNGQDQPCFLLPKRECMLVISGYSVKYRLAIIDRLEELEAKASKPQRIYTRVEQARMALAEAELAELIAKEVAPIDNYGSISKNGEPKIGLRRASFVASKSKNMIAEQLFNLVMDLQEQLDEANNQLQLDF